MPALVAHDIAGGMIPAVAAVMNLQPVVHIVRGTSTEVLDAGVKGRKCPLHIIRVQTRAPRLDRVREVRLSTETDHTAELIRPYRVVNTEIRIDLHVPHSRLDRLIDRAQTEPLVFQLLVHTVDQRVQLIGIRLTAVQLREELVLFMTCNDSLNRPCKILCASSGSTVLVKHCIPSKKQFPNLGLLYHIHPYMQAVVEDSLHCH